MDEDIKLVFVSEPYAVYHEKFYQVVYELICVTFVVDWMNSYVINNCHGCQNNDDFAGKHSCFNADATSVFAQYFDIALNQMDFTEAMNNLEYFCSDLNLEPFLWKFYTAETWLYLCTDFKYTALFIENYGYTSSCL